MFQTEGCTIRGKDIDEVWEQWFHTITRSDEIAKKDSRDGAVVGEVLNAVTIIDDPTRCILKSKIRNLPMRYMVGELLWYLSGNNELDAIRMYTSAWDRMSDDGQTVNSNYGYRMKYAVDEQTGETFDQLKMIENMLKESPESRQAVIHIKGPRNLFENPSKDVNCTVCLQFFVRGGKLYMTTYMRSNDLWMGFPNDVFQFTAIQVYLAMRLGYQLGSYTHIAGSLHLYERDAKKAMENIDKATDTLIDGVPAIKGRIN